LWVMLSRFYQWVFVVFMHGRNFYSRVRFYLMAGRILSDLGILLIGILLFPPALRYRTHRNLVKLENYIDNALPL